LPQGRQLLQRVRNERKCNISPTSARAKGHALNTMTATILTISMADANNNNNLQTATKQQQKTKPS
jgi:hypothetical protein